MPKDSIAGWRVSGRYWAKVGASGADCGLHCSSRYFLQSLSTDEFKPDPVTLGREDR